MSVKSLYVSIIYNMCLKYYTVYKSSASSLDPPVLLSALHGDEVRCYMLPPGLLSSHWPSLLRKGYEHFFSIFSPLCRGVSIEVVFQENLLEVAVFIVDPLALQLSSLVHGDIILTLHPFDSQDASLRHCPDLQDTVAVGWVLSPIDVAKVINCEEPLRATEQLPNAHVPSLHVVIVPGVALVSGAVHNGSKLLWSAVTVDHTHTAKQEDCMQVQSREQILKVPCQHPFAHYSKMQWGSMNNILKCGIEICVLPLSPANP